MPSTLPLPSIEELRTAFHQAVRGQKDSLADDHDGSVYDHFAGIGAILWSWEGQRDRDMFEAIYFDKATGQALTDYVYYMDGIDRIEDVKGIGWIEVSRSSSSGGTGTFWRGTRVQVFGNTSIYYEVLSDTTLSGTSGVVPIIALKPGPDSVLDVTGGCTIIDPLWDNTWVIGRLVCRAGTLFEEAPQFRSRVKIERLKRKVGYPDPIIRACKAQGAERVFLLQSDFGGDALDFGVNCCYVGDHGYGTPTELIYKVTTALEGVRVCGADLLILPMQQSILNFDIVLNTWTTPQNLNTFEIKRTAISAIVDYFYSNNYAYDLNAISGAIRRLMPEVIQQTTFNSPTVSQPILNGAAFPPTLTKYVVTESNITVSLAGPV